MNAWLSGWLDAMAAGATIEEVRAAISASPEFEALNAGNEAFIQGLYRLFLSRDGETTGIAYWADKFAQGWTRNQVALGFQQSMEYTHFSIEQLYQVYLGRTADTAGVDYWTQQLTQSHDTARVLPTILGSQEYDHL